MSPYEYKYSLVTVAEFAKSKGLSVEEAIRAIEADFGKLKLNATDETLLNELQFAANPKAFHDPEHLQIIKMGDGVYYIGSDEFDANRINRDKQAEKSFYIAKKTPGTLGTDYLLKLDRNNRSLVVLHQVERGRLHDHFSIRKDFDPTPYVMFEEVKAFPCIFGGEKSPTPEGTFQVEYKTTDEYVSGYYPEHDKVKFFGYLVIFEDYFIHSDLYDGTATEAAMRAGKAEPISRKDDHTFGCVRIAQENLDWLVENIPFGTTVVL